MKSMTTVIAVLALARLAGAPEVETRGEPAPGLAAAAETLAAVWGATARDESRAAIERTFTKPMELYLATPEVSGALSRDALLTMADELGTGGVDRAWETDEESWFLSERMAVRKARERLREGDRTRAVLTTSVFERRETGWVLVHAHHSEYDAAEGGR